MADPHELTEDEMLEALMRGIWSHIDYWSAVKLDPGRDSVNERLSGLAHSLLSMLDGCTGATPAFDLVARPHEEDKAFHQENGEDWWPDGGTISTMLHECLYDKRWRRDR